MTNPVLPLLMSFSILQKMWEIMGWWSLKNQAFLYVSQRCFHFVAWWIAVQEKQYECNCCVMNGPRSFTASTATPPASTDLFRHTRLVDQSSSSGTAGINTDYTTEVGSTTQIHFFPTLNEKIQLFFFLHLNFFEVLLIFAESCGVLEDFAALIWFSLEWIFILQKKREVEPKAQSARISEAIFQSFAL